MAPVVIELLSPIASLFLLVLGTGFTFTQMGVILTVLEVSPLIIGALTGVFYAGLVLGSIRVEAFISRVGHIRAYATFSSMLAILYLFQVLHYSVITWLIIRFLAGFATAGLYVVIESWVLHKSDKMNRGRILSIYMIVFYASQSFGQFFINAVDNGSLFILSSILCSLSIIPLAITRVASPLISAPSNLKFYLLIKKTLNGLLGALSSGMMMGAIYGLMPAVLRLKFDDLSTIANYMFTVIIGGMILQYPIGRLSDYFPRKKVFVTLCFLVILTCVILLYFPEGSPWYWYPVMLFFGGLTFTLYPLSIAYACDSLDPPDIIAGTQSLLLAYSMGAMIGPFIAPAFMYYSPEHGLFYYLMCISLLIIPPFLFQKKEINDGETQEQSQ